jgi:cation transport ATPase
LALHPAAAAVAAVADHPVAAAVVAAAGDGDKSWEWGIENRESISPEAVQ